MLNLSDELKMVVRNNHVAHAIWSEASSKGIEKEAFLEALALALAMQVEAVSKAHLDHLKTCTCSTAWVQA